VASGEQIRQREFATVRRGYDPDQVRSYLFTLAAHVDALERSLAEVRARVAELEAAPPPAPTDPYEQLSKRFAGVLATADSQAAEVVEQARDEAARIKAEAQARAEEVRIRSSQSLIAAQQESDRMMANLAERRQAMLRQLHEMQTRLLSVADDLEVAIQPQAPTAPAPPQAPATPPTGAPEAHEGPAPSRSEPSSEPGRARSRAPLDDLWAKSGSGTSGDQGLAGLFDDTASDDVDLPDLSGLDLDLGEERGGDR
jgi:cell division initiation protein